nr:CRISPR-associated protein Cas4 [Roseofilum casamattae]
MPMNTEIPISALNQYAYCPHRCWRMFCAGEFTDNAYTIEGTTLHDRVHTIGQEMRDDTWQVRAIWLKSERYNLIGKSDLIEAQNGKLYPVEYKRGKTGDHDNDALQVCAQALCLEEMTGTAVTQGFVYYAQSHQRHAIAIDEPLRQKAIATIKAIKTLLSGDRIPPPKYSPRCRGCSLYSACLPQTIKKLKTYQEIT